MVFGNVADGGQIWGTNTGYYGSGADVHGDVTYFKNQIVKLMQTWDFAEFEVEIDRAGSDIDHFIQASADPNVCRDACYANENCRAFTYVNPGVQGPQAHCWLKGSIPDFSSNPNCTSGTNLTREVNIDRPGMDYSSFALVEPRSELCLAACARDENCKAYTYVVPGVQGTQARCWLKNGIPARSSNGNATAGVRRGMEYNVDRGGWDYSHFTLGSANPILCQTACANDARCKAFTYVAPGVQGASAGCWLKTDADAPRSMSNVISAMKRGLEVNTDRAGSDYRNFVPSSNVPEVCQAECAKDAACVAWTFVPSHVQGDGARCWLKNSIPAASSQEGIVSGLKGAEFF